MTNHWKPRGWFSSVTFVIVFTLMLGQLFKADLKGQGASSMPPADGSETGTVSGPMCQILARARDAVKATRGKTLCDQAALDLAWYVINDAANDGPIGGFLRAIRTALSEILSLGQSDVEEYLRDKIKDALQSVPDAIEDYIKQKVSGRKPEVYLDTVSKNGCSVTIRAKWDIAAGTYDIWVEGDCPVCTSQIVLTGDRDGNSGGSIKRSVPLRHFLVHVHGNVKINIDHTNLVPSLSFPDRVPPSVTVTAICGGDTCTTPKTPLQPKKPGDPPMIPGDGGRQPVPPPGTGGGVTPGNPLPPSTPVGPTPPPTPGPAPMCRKANECDGLGVIAREKQADYDRAKNDPLQNGDSEQKFADDQERSAQKYEQEAKRLSDSNGDQGLVDELKDGARQRHETAQEYAQKAKAKRENVERLRQEAEQARQAYENCLRRPLCPEPSKTVTPPPPPPPPPPADPKETRESSKTSSGSTGSAGSSTGVSIPLKTLATLVGQVLAGIQNVVLNGTVAIAGDPHSGAPWAPAAPGHDMGVGRRPANRWSPRSPAGSMPAGFARFVLGWITPAQVFATAPGHQLLGALTERHANEGPAFGNQKADGLAGLRVVIVAAGRSTKLMFQLRVVNPFGEAVPIDVPDGLVLQPLKDPAPVVRGSAGSERATPALIDGYCLNFAKLPPQEGLQYRIADRLVQEQYAPIARIMRASRTLAAEGRLHADTDANAYADSIEQLSIWSEVEHWTPEEIERHFLEMTRKNVEGTGRKWTGDLERLAKQLVPARLGDVAAVHREAQRLTADER